MKRIRTRLALTVLAVALVVALFGRVVLADTDLGLPTLDFPDDPEHTGQTP